MLDTLTRLRNQVEDEGYELESNDFKFRLLTLKVEKCMEAQNVTLCSSCAAYFGCELTMEHLRWKKFGPPKTDASGTGK